MENIRQRFERLEREWMAFKSKVQELSKNEGETYRQFTAIGRVLSKALNHPTDISTGKGAIRGGILPWNDSEANFPPYPTAGNSYLKPDDPTVGYHKHAHGEYSGGALDINTLKLVEYERNTDGNYILDTLGNELNPHCQHFWATTPKIAKTSNGVQKIGLLDIEFDSATGKWLASGKANYIDVENTYLVQYAYHKYDDLGNRITQINDEGVEVPVEYNATEEGVVKEIKIDENGNEMKSPLLVSGDSFRSNIIWDTDAQTWRYYAVFRPWEED